MQRPLTPIQKAMALAAVTGSRSALGPALLAASRRSPYAGVWALASLGEMLMDKLGVLPPRYKPALMIPRALAGAYVARESLRGDGVEDPTGVAAGAVIAAGVSSVAPMLRIALNSGLRLPDSLVGLAEDALALSVGAKAVGLTVGEVKDHVQESVGGAVQHLTDTMPQFRQALTDVAERFGVELPGTEPAGPPMRSLTETPA